MDCCGSEKEWERIRVNESNEFPVVRKGHLFCFEDEREKSEPWRSLFELWLYLLSPTDDAGGMYEKNEECMPELTAVTTVCCSDDTHWTTQHVRWLFFFGKFFASRSFSCCWVLFSVGEKFFSPRLPADPLGEDGFEEGMLLLPLDATTRGPPFESTRVKESFVWLLLLTSFA